jgi:hypothetical protein
VLRSRATCKDVSDEARRARQLVRTTHAKEPSGDILNVLRHQDSEHLLAGGLLARPAATDVDLLPFVDLRSAQESKDATHAPS